MAGRDLLARLGEILAPHEVRSDKEMLTAASTDWTGRFQGSTSAVVLPSTREHLQQLLSLLSLERVPFVPQGGNTSLVGGSVPMGGEVVIRTSGLVGVVDLDERRREVVVRSGTSLEALQREAYLAGLEFPVDLAVRGQASIGGMVATNAAGLKALRHGRMREQVLGLSVVLSDGSLIDRLGNGVKDGAGYDLVDLFVGSEGTLGIVELVRLALQRPPAARRTFIVGFERLLDAVTAASEALFELECLESVEYFDLVALQLHADRQVEAIEALGSSFVLFEAVGTVEEVDALERFIVRRGLGPFAIRGRDEHERATLWAYRAELTSAIQGVGVPHKFDIGLRLAQLPSFVDELRHIVAELAAAATLVVFGHLGEGNLHVNILGLSNDDDRCDEVVLSLVARYGGSIAAEHGVGRAKAKYLGLSRSREDRAAMEAIKAALDPDGLCNPGVLLR